jgi:hypothetical protein
MPRYFRHLRDASDDVLDPDGVMMPEDAVASAALVLLVTAGLMTSVPDGSS